MLAFLFSLILSWQTEYIGEPYMTFLKGPRLAVATHDEILVLYNLDFGSTVWRTNFRKAEALYIHDYVLIAAKEHYLYYIDIVNGLLVGQVPHNLTHITGIGALDDVTFVRNATHLASYDENNNEKWIIELKDQREGIFVSKYNVTCGNTIYDLETGAVMPGSVNIDYSEFSCSFKYQPKLIEFYHNDELIWTVNQPLYRAKVLYPLMNSRILLKNDTHIFVFDTSSEEILFEYETTVYSHTQLQKLIILNTTEGLMQLSANSLNFKKCTKNVHSGYIMDNKVIVNNKDFIFPNYCQNISSASSNYGVIVTAQCNNSSEIVVLNNKGDIKGFYSSQNINVELLSTYQNYGLLVYSMKHPKERFIQYFDFTNSLQKRSPCPFDVQAIANGQIIGTNGRLHSLESLGSDQSVSMSSLLIPSDSSVGIYTNISVYIDLPYSYVLQNYDIIYEMKDSGDIQIKILILTIISCISFYYYITSFSQKKVSFWSY